MVDVLEVLERNRSQQPSKWREKAVYRLKNREQLKRSQAIALMMLERMEEEHVTQKMLAERMDISQQYVSKLLKGNENLTLETILKIEQALNLHILAI